MRPTRDVAWFRRKVRELGDALAALSPERLELARDVLDDDPPREQWYGTRYQQAGRTMRRTKGKGR